MSDLTMDNPEGDALWWQRLDWMKDQQPELLASLLKKGRQALRDHLDSTTAQANLRIIRLTERGMPEQDALEDVVKTYLTPDNSRMEELPPAPLSPLLQRRLKAFENSFLQ